MCNKFTDLPTVTNIRHISTICVTSLNISWDPSSIRCGDVSYEVLVSQPTIEGGTVEVLNISGLVDRFLSLSGLNNSLPVEITVTATDRVGQRIGSTAVLQLRVSEGKFV